MVVLRCFKAIVEIALKQDEPKPPRNLRRWVWKELCCFFKEILVINNNCDVSWRMIMHEENLVFVDIKNNLVMWMYSALQVLIFLYKSCWMIHWFLVVYMLLWSISIYSRHDIMLQNGTMFLGSCLYNGLETCQDSRQLNLPKS